MEGWTTAGILGAVLGSIGGIGGIIAIARFVSERLEVRRKRIDDGDKRKIADAVEVKRLELAAEGQKTVSVEAALWKLIEEKQNEITDLRIRVIDCEKKATLDRPLINKLYMNIRAMRRDLDSLHKVRRTQEESERFTRVRELLDATEAMLP